MHPDEEGIRELIETEIPGSKIRVMKNSGGGILIFYRVRSCISKMHLDSEIREFITKVQSLFSSQMGLSMTASIGGMIRKNKDILPAKEEAERIMKGRVFHRASAFWTGQQRMKGGISAEIKDALRCVEENIEKDSYENIARLFGKCPVPQCGKDRKSIHMAQSIREAALFSDAPVRSSGTAGNRRASG